MVADGGEPDVVGGDRQPDEAGTAADDEGIGDDPDRG